MDPSNEQIEIQKKISDLQQQISENLNDLNSLRQSLPQTPVPDYEFTSEQGSARLSELFGQHDKLFVIHNMGQGCRYCTLWGDALNPFVQHIESTASLIMVSGDLPEIQRQFANSRQWRFRMLSHGKNDYYDDQVKTSDYENAPGIVCYQKHSDHISKLASDLFGPGDLYCSLWHILALAGISAADWTPQYRYWSRPESLEDGGSNIID